MIYFCSAYGLGSVDTVEKICRWLVRRVMIQQNLPAFLLAMGRHLCHFAGKVVTEITCHVSRGLAGARRRFRN